MVTAGSLDGRWQEVLYYNSDLALLQIHETPPMQIARDQHNMY